MKKYATVMIYEDPLTCEIKEDKVQLIRKIKEDKTFEYWEAAFIGDPYGTCRRKIKKEK